MQQSTRVSSLLQQHHHATTLLLKHQKESQEKGKEALGISDAILFFNKQILNLKEQIESIKNKINFENYKLASVEKGISSNSSIIYYFCDDLKRISKEIEV
jgi:hypothetical protein